MTTTSHATNTEAFDRLYEMAHRDGAAQATVSTDDLRLLLGAVSPAKGLEPEFSILHIGTSGRGKEFFSEALANQIKLLSQALGECIGAAGIIREEVGLTGPELLHFAQDLKNHVAGFEQSQTAYNAVINYVLANPCESPMEFLRCWREGSFDTLREEWPDAPEDIYLADSTHPDFIGFGLGTSDEPVELAGTKLLVRSRDSIAVAANTDVHAAALLSDLAAYLDEQTAPSM